MTNVRLATCLLTVSIFSQLPPCAGLVQKLPRRGKRQRVDTRKPSGASLKEANVTCELPQTSPPAASDIRAYHELLASFPPLPCRDNLAELAEKLFYKSGNAGEIGVYRGAFSAHNLRFWSGKYYAIDAWQFRPNEEGTKWLGELATGHSHDRGGDKNYIDPIQHARNYNMTRDATAFAGRRVHLIRDFSAAASRQFPDEHFDWLYVDALHTYEGILHDLQTWWPKLRRGGMMSGDDYADAMPTKFMPSQLMTKIQGGRPKAKNWGTMRATQCFAHHVGSLLQVTWSKHCYQYPAWYLVKIF